MTQKHNIPRLVISAPHGRSGKTTITIGILAALTKNGYQVQPFKKGPDYIDPSWHKRATGLESRNLDCYMMDNPTIKNSFVKGAHKCDLSLIEGAMGLHDGFDLDGTGSTAQVAKIIKAPVVLVIDTRRMTRSIAPLVMGFQVFDQEVEIAAVILNHVARPRHEKILRGAIEKYCGIPVIGAIPKDDNLIIPNRHLGLIPAQEEAKNQEALQYISKTIENGINLKQLIEIAEKATPLEIDTPLELETKEENVITIGVIKDRAFSFYYPENLEALQEKGANLVYIDSINDPVLPDIDGLYIGGGIPEVFAKELENNKSIRADIKAKAENGLPIYAESGGLMFLGQQLITNRGNYNMVGLFPFDVQVGNKPQGHGYTRLSVNTGNPFFKEPGTVILGHEFHNTKIINLDDGEFNYAFNVERGKGINGLTDGIIYKNVLASYNYIHSLATPQWAHGFIELVKKRAYK